MCDSIETHVTMPGDANIDQHSPAEQSHEPSPPSYEEAMAQEDTSMLHMDTRNGICVFLPPSYDQTMMTSGPLLGNNRIGQQQDLHQSRGLASAPMSRNINAVARQPYLDDTSRGGYSSKNCAKLALFVLMIVITAVILGFIIAARVQHEEDDSNKTSVKPPSDPLT
ncbi:MULTISPECIES: hypothetical protein [Candidatus Ichthyocystis]|uniref:hypothetical protein n=1 Tax=Candidatus Ichthyocystis TaxID=2929841 RepID=UPI000B80F106|nr:MULTISPECIES: hypothetical protein [Ichthyocystis]